MLYYSKGCTALAILLAFAEHNVKVDSTGILIGKIEYELYILTMECSRIYYEPVLSVTQHKVIVT